MAGNRKLFRDTEGSAAVGVERSPFAFMICAQTKTDTSPAVRAEEAWELQDPWKVVVLNDPVNLMSYVVMVFKKVLGFDEIIARRHMLEVHEQGRSVVWSGLRERAEHYAFILQRWHLTAVLERDEKD